MPVNKLLHELSSSDISEWMAFDMLKDEETAKRLKSEVETPEDTSEQLMAFFKIKSPNIN